MSVSGAPPGDLLARSLRVTEAYLEALADVREERPWGWAMRRTAHPLMWDHNALVVRGPQPTVTAIALAEDADAFLGGLNHRKVHVLDEATGDRLQPDFERLGWKVEDLVAMTSRSPAPAPAGDLPPVDEVAGPEAIESLRMAWWLEESWGQEQEDLELVAVAERDAERRMPPRVFVTRRDGEPASYAYLRRSQADPSLGEIDSVYALPDARGERRGAAVVLAAWRAAFDEGCDAVFLWADAVGPARRFYEQLGLEAVGRRLGFYRPPGAP